MVNKYELTQIIEEIAPPETAESWDLSGWIVETPRTEVSKVMLCLTVTEDILRQAGANGCDMIISHHPLFFVPLDFNCGIEIYCAHTNLDKAKCGTTVSLLKNLGFSDSETFGHEYLHFCDFDGKFEDLIKKLQKISQNIRFTNPMQVENVSRVAFCAGSGTEFWDYACECNADVLVTGDLKFHTALDSKIAIIDIGHFESEIFVLDELERLLGNKIPIQKAKEKSPITQINS